MKKLSKPLVKFLLLALLVRVFLQLVAAVAIARLSFLPTYPHWDITLINKGPEWLWLWGGFDGVHYLNIAEKGYEYGLTQAFFPLYPLMIRFLTAIINNPLWSALIISHLSFIGFAYFFIKLGRLDFKLKQISMSWLWLLIFPTSFFFFGVYTESLFLLLAAATLYNARKRQFWLAAMLAGLASGSRIIGIFLLPAVLWEYYQVNPKPKLKNIIGLAMLGASGLVSYLTYLQLRFHDWLIFVHAQPGFGAGRQVDQVVMIYQVVARYGKMFLTVSTSNDIYGVLMFEFASSILVLGLIVYGWWKKWIRMSYLIYMLPAYFLPTITGSFASMPRYILSLFPLFYLLPKFKLGKYQQVIMVILVALMTWAFVRFSRGYWVS